ncbi:hypothetical protein GCM10009734_19640 [Nonomuraea bangladeshensis]
MPSSAGRSRDFTAERPGIKLVGDITYVRTWEGFLYLATVIDCPSKAVLGWAMTDPYRAELVKEDPDGRRHRSAPARRRVPYRPRLEPFSFRR